MKPSTSIWHLLHNFKSTVKILSILVAFWENANFTRSISPFFQFYKVFVDHLSGECIPPNDCSQRMTESVFFTIGWSQTMVMKNVGQLLKQKFRKQTILIKNLKWFCDVYKIMYRASEASFDFRNFWFNTLNNSILFSSP